MKRRIVAATEPVIQIERSSVRLADVYDAEGVLLDNGISNRDEAKEILQAIGYVLLDTELYPEE